MKLNNNTYDVLKKIAQIWLPALATLYFALAQIWGLPYAEQIVGTITAIDAFLGVILGISSSSYSKEADGVITISQDEIQRLDCSRSMEDLSKADSVTFKIQR